MRALLFCFCTLQGACAPFVERFVPPRFFFRGGGLCPPPRPPGVPIPGPPFSVGEVGSVRLCPLPDGRPVGGVLVHPARRENPFSFPPVG